MRRVAMINLALVAVVVAVTAGVAAAAPTVTEVPPLSLAFEPERGGGSAAAFVARGRGYAVRLEARGVRVQVGGESLRTELRGARSAAVLTGEEQLPGTVNYFFGSDPAQWRTGVATFAKVRARQVYPGIDVLYYGAGRLVEFDFEVRPGADPALIQLGFAGQQRLSLNERGDLIVRLARGEVVQHRPVAYQEIEGVRQRVEAAYALGDDGTVTFRLGRFDPSRLLVIDPVLSYASYLGGSLGESVEAVAVDGAGNLYAAGTTTSADFPIVNAYTSQFPGACGFVTKLNAAGTAIVYSTYIAGVYGVSGIAVDAGGNAYLSGTTYGDLPVKGAFQGSHQGGSDAFLTKLGPAGNTLVYSTYLGGSEADEGWGLALDGAGKAYLTGTTWSPGFPTVSAYQSTMKGDHDAFVSVFNAAGNGLTMSTFLGGTDWDQGRGIGVDASGNIVVAGHTFSVDFPVKNAYQSASGGNMDWFVSKLTAAGGLVYSTYLGGGGVEGADVVAVDGAGNAYVAGGGGGGFPLKGSLQAPAGDIDLAIVKLSAAGGLQFSTLWGGSGNEEPGGIALDGAGNIFVAGYTRSSNFPTVNPSQATYGGDGADAIVVSLNGSGTQVLYSTYFGGNDLDEAQGIAVDAAGNAYIGGLTASTNLPTKNPFQAALKGDQDAFVAKLQGGVTPAGNLYVVPSVAHSPGKGTSQWRSTITAVNRGATAATVTLTFLSTTGETRTASETLGAGATKEWPDILVSRFGYAASANVSGSLQLLSTQPLFAYSRTYNQAASGTFGQYYPALAVSAALTSGQTGTLPGVKKNTAFRTNVGIQNLGETSCQVRVTLYSTSGAQVGSPVTETVGAWAWKQINDVVNRAGAGSADLAYAKVEVLTAGGKAWAYASVVDNVTDDPTTVPLMF